MSNDRRNEWLRLAGDAVSNLSDAADPHLAAQRAIMIADALLAAADARFLAAAPVAPVAPVLPSVVPPAPPVPYRKGDR